MKKLIVNTLDELNDDWIASYRLFGKGEKAQEELDRRERTRLVRLRPKRRKKN